MKTTAQWLFFLFVVGIISISVAGTANAFCVKNDSNGTIFVKDFIAGNSKSLDNGNIDAGYVACKDGKQLQISETSPLHRGQVQIVSSNQQSYDCEISPGGIIVFNGEKCITKRAGYKALDRSQNISYSNYNIDQ